MNQPIQPVDYVKEDVTLVASDIEITHRDIDNFFTEKPVYLGAYRISPKDGTVTID
jgi:hypothetical protein